MKSSGCHGNSCFSKKLFTLIVIKKKELKVCKKSDIEKK